eukprot:TRINITY_DN36230_c0_g1_i1.p2 TRINITY_DN36230_c0_g1~~TRINITY_DN36230_c0_g1_i1.p2  ORF type:complete len:305 (-),score=29.31 TRINITY_DN36230_c0_g1_i1:345-1259(-)
MPTTDLDCREEGRVKLFLRLARPHQYTKNLFVFLPAFFGGSLAGWDAVGSLCLAFIVFCLLSSSVYALNDVLDRQEDRNHPIKQYRPVASGRMGAAQALVFSGGLVVLAAVLLWFFGDAHMGMVAGGYVVLNLAYCYGLKHRAIIDVSCIALGFILRVLAGSYASGVEVSHWLLLMTYLLAMFLALGKRWDDLRIVEENGQPNVRRALDGYSPDFVRTAMVIMASVNLVAYIMYTTSDKVVCYYGTSSVFLTTIWVLTGILRYMQLTLLEHGAGSPARVLLTDRFIQVVVAGWILHLSFLLYMK